MRFCRFQYSPIPNTLTKISSPAAARHTKSQRQFLPAVAKENGVRSADCFGTRLRAAKVQDSSVLDQILNRVGHVLDGHFWIAADPARALGKEVSRIG